MQRSLRRLFTKDGIPASASISEAQINAENAKAQSKMNYKVRVSPNKSFSVTSSIPSIFHMKRFVQEQEVKQNLSRLDSVRSRVAAWHIGTITVAAAFILFVVEQYIYPEFRRRSDRLEAMEKRLKLPKTVRFD